MIEMAYQELGEARILKRYGKADLLEPVRGTVNPVRPAGDWQTLDQAAARFLRDLQQVCVTTR